MGSIPQGFSSQLGIDGLNACAQSADVLIVVPAYNEEANIEKVVRKLERLPYDYVVINDGSCDATPRILDEMKANHIDLCQNLGIGGAVQTGYKYALNHGYQIAVQFDGDGQHDESCIDRLIQPILDGKADMTVGSRFVGEGKPRLQAAQSTDDVGQSMWALNLMLANGQGTYAELTMKLNSYRL